MELTIDAAGKIEIPREFMEKLHLAPGMPLTVEMSGDKIVLLPLCNEPGLKYVNGGLAGKFDSTDDPNLKYVDGILIYTGKINSNILDPVEEMRKERDEFLMKGLNGESESDE